MKLRKEVELKLSDVILDQLEGFVSSADDSQGITRITFKTRNEIMEQYDAVTAQRIMQSVAVENCQSRGMLVYAVPDFFDTFPLIDKDTSSIPHCRIGMPAYRQAPLN